MENEISNFTNVCLSVVASLCYCYAIGHIVAKGPARLFCLLPFICLFLYLPRHLHTVHLGGLTAFFIAWLANFKLLMFPFGIGPLCSDPSISLPRFVAIGCLPIKVQQDPSLKSSPPQKPKNSKKSPLNFAIKSLLLSMLVRVHDHSDYFHPKIVSFLYCLYMYIVLEVALAIVAAQARGVLGLELEAQFNEPYLSSSLQDFWSRKWNLMVSSILRQPVYEPVRRLAKLYVRREWVSIPAVFATFVVSALMYELMFYYLGRRRPTFQITAFFLLHGVCLGAEIAAKKAFSSGFQLPWVVSGPLTIGFVMFTFFWLFLPSMHRCRSFERASMEINALVGFASNVGQGLVQGIAQISELEIL